LSRASVTFWCCVLAGAGADEADRRHPVRLDVPGARRRAALGIVYLLVRPVLRILTLPIGCLTLGLFGFGLDAH
jgi:hypothetical protein